MHDTATITKKYLLTSSGLSKGKLSLTGKVDFCLFFRKDGELCEACKLLFDFLISFLKNSLLQKKFFTKYRNTKTQSSKNCRATTSWTVGTKFTN